MFLLTASTISILIELLDYGNIVVLKIYESDLSNWNFHISVVVIIYFHQNFGHTNYKPAMFPYVFISNLYIYLYNR